MAGVMLDCAICSTRKWQTLEPADGEELRQAGATRLYCSTCDRETYWLYSQHERGSSPERITVPPPAALANDSAAADAGAAAPPSEGGNAKPGTVRSYQIERRTGPERRHHPRRGHRRVALQMPVRIRAHTQAAPFEEVTRTVNVCRNGIYFQSERPYSKGLAALVALNYSPREPDSLAEQKGTVVRVDSEPGARLHGVAIQLQ